MKITRVLKIDRVTVSREPEEEWPECPTWSRNFTLHPDRLVIEFDNSPSATGKAPEEAVLRLDAHGERYRHLKAGPAPKGRATIEYGSRVPAVLVPMIRQIALERYSVTRG